MKTQICTLGRTGRTILTVTILGNTKRTLVEFPDHTCSVMFSKIKE